MQPMLTVAPDADAGPRTIRSDTERLCIVTRNVKPIAEMIRFVIGPDAALVPDVKRKLPGRGVWVTAARSVLTTAVQRKLFARAFKRDVRVAPDFVDLVERLFERAALDALAIAHKAGRVVAGFTKVEAAIADEAVVAILHAAEAGEDGVRKLAAVATRRCGDDALQPAQVRAFSGAQLDLALGRSNVVHAAVLAGPASDGFLARCRSLARFRSEEGSSGSVVARGHDAMGGAEFVESAKT